MLAEINYTLILKNTYLIKPGILHIKGKMKRMKDGRITSIEYENTSSF